MSSANSNIIISGLQTRWRNSEFTVLLLFALAESLPVIALLHISYAVNLFWTVPLMAGLFVLHLLIFPAWRVKKSDVARTLNQQHPDLEESTGLLLKPANDLGFLESLQVRKISPVLERIDPPAPSAKRLRAATIVLICSSLIATLLLVAAPYLINKSAISNTEELSGLRNKPEIILPQITSVTVRIQPPAYTGRDARTQHRFNVQAEHGAKLTWEINTKGDPTSLQFIFNDSSVVDLESLSKKPGVWATEKLIKSNGFYQVRIGNTLSELYQLEIIPDQQPVITVQTPRPATIIEFGQSQQVSLTVSLADDYGIIQTNIIATIASGSGEAVKFKEQKLSFNDFTSGGRQYKLGRTFSLPALGMKPGDELYFYISAIDNSKQETKSDIYTVKIEDTAVLMSMDGMMSGIDLKPEFFRSQRQIIIETEQLLKGRDTMSREAFNNRSNALGIDQKLLRLRYGKFLGEENETNIGEEGHKAHDDKNGGEHHEESADHDEKISIEDFNNAEKLIDRFSHKHDIAEDATFFDPQTKKDLRATLVEMWQSELRLRTYDAAGALPFEYKALRLLKELQQKSREYVAKTNTKTTPLKPSEKRLTGELDKIVEPASKQTFQATDGKEINLKTALSVLSGLKEQLNHSGNRVVLSNPEHEILEQAAGQLSLRASREPASYLASFEAIKRLVRNEIAAKDVISVEIALQKIIRTSARSPANQELPADMNLSKEYFLNLNKSGRRS